MLRGFVLFAILVGILGESCDPSRQTHCDHHLPERREFPDSVEEFNNTCPQIIAYLECLTEFTNGCGAENVPDGTHLPEKLAYMRDACDKDSETHANIFRLLPCLLTELHNQDKFCKAISNSALFNYKEANQISDEDTIFEMHSFCFHISSNVACYIAQVDEKCESGAKNFVLDALGRTKYLDTVCSKQNTEKFLELLEVLELSMSIKNNIREIIESV